MRIKKGDNVIILAGKDKGKTGKVVDSLPVRNQVIVEGLNKVKKHQKSRSKDQKGGIIEMSMPINVSNVAIVDPKTNKPTRIGYEVKGGKKVRVTKKSESVLNN
jgi:large subunit ribosomal protein L24